MVKLREITIDDSKSKTVIKTLDNFEPETIVKKIKKDCKESIGLFKDTNFVFTRGIKNAPFIYLGEPRKDRISLNTPKDFQQKFDNTLLNLGFKATRSNSIFVEGERISDYLEETTKNFYGPKYIIFPFDNFDYTWSPRLYDMYIAWPKEFDQKEMSEKDIENFIKEYKFTNKDIKSALTSQNEIAINSKFYAIYVDFFLDLEYLILGTL